MDAISWYALGRTVNDPTTIMEEIDTKILTHNLDASAHGQSNEAVYNHRIAELLDHVSYSIYNVKMNPAARIYKAIVGPGFEADFSTVQAAIDWAHLYGGGIVHIKAGTYQQTDDIVLYSDIILQGEDDDLSIISFDGVYKGVIINGTVGTHKKNVTLKDLCIRDSYIDGQMVDLQYADDVIIQDCKFDNTTGELGNQPTHLYLGQGCNRIHIRRNRFLNGWTDIIVGASKYVWIDQNYFEDNERDCISGGGAQYFFIRDNVFTAYRTDENYEGAIYFDAANTEMTITGNQFYHGGGNAIYLTGQDATLIANNIIHSTTDSYSGIYFDTCIKCTIVGNNIDNCTGSGIDIVVSDRNVIVGNTITDGSAYGLDIEGATCDYNVVVGNVMTGNSSGGIHDLGTGTVKTGNYP